MKSKCRRIKQSKAAANMFLEDYYIIKPIPPPPPPLFLTSSFSASSYGTSSTDLEITSSDFWMKFTFMQKMSRRPMHLQCIPAPSILFVL